MDLHILELIKHISLPLLLKYGATLTLAITTLSIGWWLIGTVTGKISGVLGKRSVDKTLQGFVGSLANIALKIMLIISVASMIGVQTTSFVAALGAAGLAIGLALQGSLANFAGGVLILLFRPFKVGDTIEVQDIYGTVDSILIFHTVILSPDNKRIVVPNGSLSNGVIVNFSSEALRKVVFDVGVDYSANLDTARQVLLGLCNDARIHTDPAPLVVVTALGDSAVTLSLRVWAANSDYWDLMFLFNEKARDALAQKGIGIPFPQRVVTVIKG
ncbi:mechanosensitive ion channel family protein [Pseudomonas chlororaphis]|uniref:mechanosensitive ion channel family protein n=1 Tax=Pseudomonas chlororaphis TaxID=587753 RepID=UPI000F58E61B|nr:mechanosensitive ion channel domain-containing protein [Pseudomonas chlororaphis]AZC83984.1 Small-conductance mechanosensitive channel [Pseudomonas chlororaphis subsp. piscium]